MSQRDAHEHYAIAARKLHWIAAALATMLALVMFAMYILQQSWLRSDEPALTVEPPIPRLQPNPLRDLQAERSRGKAQLERYGWEDRRAGIARIPVERAMQLLASPSQAPAPAPDESSTGISR